MEGLRLTIGYLTGLQLFAAEPLPWATLLATGFVVNLCDAIMCRIVARNGGRPPRLWFGLGMVFGVWAFAALMLSPRRRAPTAEHP